VGESIPQVQRTWQMSCILPSQSMLVLRCLALRSPGQQATLLDQPGWLRSTNRRPGEGAQPSVILPMSGGQIAAFAALRLMPG